MVKYLTNFPKMKNFLLTADYNNDGKDDISLEGKDIALNFNLDSSDCDTLATKPGALFFHSNVPFWKVSSAFTRKPTLRLFEE